MYGGKQRYKKVFKNLEKTLIEHGLDTNDLIEITGLSNAGINKKRNGFSDFKLTEAKEIRDYLNAKFKQNYTLDYLFEE